MEIEVRVVISATRCMAYIPFTAVPDSWAGKKVSIVLIDEQLNQDNFEDDKLPF